MIPNVSCSSFSVGASFAMQADWELADLVRKKFMDYGFSGYFDQLERNYGPKVPKADASQPKPVPFKSFSAVFVMTLGIGLGATAIQIVLFISARNKLSPADK